MNVMECVSDGCCNVLAANDDYLHGLGLNAVPRNFLELIPSSEHDYIMCKIRRMLVSQQAIVTTHDSLSGNIFVRTKWIDMPVYHNKSGKLKWIYSIGTMCPCLGGGDAHK